MTVSQATLQELSREQCLELLRTKAVVGRLGFVVDGVPVVLPVNYIADRHSVVFCTAPGSKLGAMVRGGPVAFEVDDSRALYHSGWSVLVRGRAQEVTDTEEIEQLRRGPLWSWAVPSSSGHFVRISIDEISGRRIPETGRYPDRLPART